MLTFFERIAIWSQLEKRMTLWVTLSLLLIAFNMQLCISVDRIEAEHISLLAVLPDRYSWSNFISPTSLKAQIVAGTFGFVRKKSILTITKLIYQNLKAYHTNL